MTIRDASTNDIPAIQHIVEQTWWPTYSPILEEEQIRYMIDAIYSDSSLRQAMDAGNQRFIILYDEKGVQGFASFGPKNDEPSVYKLHKLYVLPENHGKGYGKSLLEEIRQRLKVKGIVTLDLNVNRFNPAKSFYERVGFRVIREEDVAIGPYWMNDYVMRLDIAAV